MDRRRFLGTSAAWAGVAGAAGLGTAALPERGWARSLESAAGPARQEGPLRLMYNENPLGLSPRAWQAVIDARGYANLYPEEQHEKLVNLLARRLGVKPANLVVGNGSTEILQMAIQAAAGPGVPLVLADPTYEDIMVYQAPHAFEVIRVPLDAEMAHDLGKMREIVDGARRPAVVYVCNPNNPTGTITPSRAIDQWIAEAPETTLFLMDEAYYEYADHPDYWSTMKFIDRPNVVTIRTFSKIFAMAGMRLGYAVTHEDTAARLNQFILTVSTNAFALAAGIASMEDTELVPRSVALNAESKRITEATLDELGLEHLPTQANFLMHRVGGDVRPYNAAMLEQGIRVGRPFPPMDEWNRVSFGLPEHMERWSEAVRGLRRRGVV